MVGGAHAGQGQQVGSADGAGAEDDLVPVDFGLAPVANQANSYGSAAVEEDSVDLAVGPDFQVGPAAYLVQVGDGGAYPHPALYVECQGAHAGGTRPVVVGTVGVAGVAAGAVEGVLLGAPCVGVVPAAGYRAV